MTFSGRPTPERLAWLIDGRRLREEAFGESAVTALWQKAVASARDAELAGMSIDGSLRAAYDAGHLAALAVLAAHGLRPTTGQGHHAAAFAGVEALSLSRLDDVIAESEQVRTTRAASAYDPHIAQEADLRTALGWMRRILPAMRAALVATNHDLDSRLVEYSAPSHTK